MINQMTARINIDYNRRIFGKVHALLEEMVSEQRFYMKSTTVGMSHR